MEPINRDDGRHWCNPGSEGVVAIGTTSTCPDCGSVWEFDDAEFGAFWVRQVPERGEN